MTSDLQIGQTLDGRFKILDVISRGGMACIYEALDCQSGTTVAVKAPLLRFESDSGYFARFEREEQIGLTLNHPFVLKFYPVDAPRSRPYIVTERLEGITLAARLEKVRPLPQSEAVHIAGQICEALDHLHEHGVAHRDLKPDNIFLCNDGSIRVVDFGIARFDQARRITFGPLSPTIGTPEYISPEQVRGKRGDSKSDVYALGTILYEMCTGCGAFDGESLMDIMNARLTGDPVAPRTRNPEITPTLEEIILHAVERDPEDRYASAAAMKAELDNPSLVAVTGRSNRLKTPQSWRTKIPLLPQIAAVLAAQVVIFLLLVWHFSHDKHSRRASGPGNTNNATSSSPK
jgi:serine/threonine-protein kinase